MATPTVGGTAQAKKRSAAPSKAKRAAEHGESEKPGATPAKKGTEVTTASKRPAGEGGADDAPRPGRTEPKAAAPPDGKKVSAKQARAGGADKASSLKAAATKTAPKASGELGPTPARVKTAPPAKEAKSGKSSASAEKSEAGAKSSAEGETARRGAKSAPVANAPATGKAPSGGGKAAAAPKGASGETTSPDAGSTAEKAPERRPVTTPTRPPGLLSPRRHETAARRTEGYTDDRFLAHQRQLLESERVTYVEQARLLRAEAESLVEEMEPGDIQFDDESGEGGTVTVDREHDLALSAQALTAVDEIDHAVAKTGNGTYGICENCGKLIPRSRLEALPYARLCIDCKSGGLYAPLTDGGTAAERPPATDSTAADSHPVGVPRRRRIVLISVIAAAVVAVDQVTKSLAVQHLSDQQIHLVGPFYLALSYNTGVAFSIGSGLTLPIVLIAVAIVGSIVWLSRGSISTLAAVAVGLILGGAVGNLADRLFRGHHGAVVDFLYSGFWPTFNVADSCIVVGSFLLAVRLWRTRTP